MNSMRQSSHSVLVNRSAVLGKCELNLPVIPEIKKNNMLAGHSSDPSALKPPFLTD